MRQAQADSRAARLVAQRRVRDVASAQARLDRLRAELDEELDAVQRRWSRPIAALESRLSRLRADLEAFCRAKRNLILPEGRKSLATAFGEIGFRQSEPLLRLRDGVTEEEACRLLCRANLDDLVRVKETPDKEALHKALNEARLTREQLRRCGLELEEPPERFHCRLRERSLGVVSVGRARP